MGEALDIVALAGDKSVRAAIHGKTPLGVPILETHSKVGGAEEVSVQVNNGRDWMEAPLRIEANPSFIELESFCDYVNRFKAGSTLLFGNVGRNSVTASLDHHDVGSPSWCAHQATLSLHLSEEWKAWESACREPIGQEAFGTLIEDMMHTIAAPAASVLMQAVTRFEIHKDAHFKKTVNLDNGNYSLSFSEEEKEQTLVVPKQLTLVLPMFDGNPNKTEVKIGIRYSTRDNRLRFGLRIIERSLIMQAARDQIYEAIQNVTGMKVLVCP